VTDHDPIAYGITTEDTEKAFAPQTVRQRQVESRQRRCLLWLGWIIVLVLLTVGLYLASQIENPKSDIVRATLNTVFSPVGLFGVLAAVIAYAGYRRRQRGYSGFFTDLSTEMVGIAITVLVIGVLVQWQDIRQQKAELIRDMGGSTNVFALRATRELRAHGWLFDETLSDADLLGANLADAKLWEANLADAYLGYANLTNAILHDADLRGARLWEANLTNASLDEANLKSADLQRANLTDAILLEANLTNALLWKANLRYAILQGANLTNANLEQADLTNASLWGANLMNASLEQADLTGASLWEANLTNAYLEQADLTGASYDNDTTWPEGFDPKAAGAINIDELEAEEQSP